MPLYEPIIPARYALPLLDFVRSQDAARLDAILQAAQLPLDELNAPNAILRMSQFDALLAAASRQLRRNDLGFELGRRISIDDHSALAQVMRSCGTLDALFSTAERYWRLITPTFKVRYRRGTRQCEWLVRVAAPMSPATMRMFLEIHAVSFHADFARLFGTEARTDIYLSIPPPAHVRRYRKLRSGRFHFSASALPEIRCVFPATLATQPLRQIIGKDAVHSADELSELIPRSLAKEYGGWVELMLREVEGLQPGLVELADMLNMSPRNLTRKLGSEGINLRQLALRIRHERGCHLLADARQSLSLIAERLGYADVTAFIRAFRNYSGTTPAQHRRGGV